MLPDVFCLEVADDAGSGNMSFLHEFSCAHIWLTKWARIFMFFIYLYSYLLFNILGAGNIIYCLSAWYRLIIYLTKMYLWHTLQALSHLPDAHLGHDEYSFLPSVLPCQCSSMSHGKEI